MGARAYDLPPITTRARRTPMPLPQPRMFVPPVPAISPITQKAPSVLNPQAQPESMSLFSDEDMSNARGRGLMGFGLSLLGDSGWAPKYGGPTLTQSLGRAGTAGLEAFDAAKQNALTSRMQHMQIRDAERLSKSRAAIMQKYPISPNMTSEQTIDTLERMFAEFSAAGDHEMSGKIGEVLKSYGGNRAAAKAPQEIRVGNEVILRDPTTGKVVDRYPIRPSPKDPNAPDTAQQLRDQRMFQREQQLTDDFNRDTRDIRGAAREINGAISEVPRAMQGDGAAQVNILYAFVKAMDPASVVREGEVALARLASPFWQQAQSLLTKYMSGESVVMPPQMLEKMGELMQRRLRGYERSVNERADYYTGRAKRWGLDATDAFPRLNLNQPTPEASAPTGGRAEQFFNFGR